MEAIDKIIEHYNYDKNSVLAILQDIQAELNYVPRQAMERIVTLLKIPMSQVSSQVTFFSSFSLKPRGENIVTVCMGTACHVRGAPRVLSELERELEIKDGETTPDDLFTIETVNCVGACALGPLVIVGKNYHGNISTSEVGALIDDYRK
jgi:NADH-quinone oxidoreductase subunit E